MTSVESRPDFVEIRSEFNEISRNPTRFRRDPLRSPPPTSRSPPLRSISFDLKQIDADPNRSWLDPWFPLVDSRLASLPPKSGRLVPGWAQTRPRPTCGQAYPWRNTVKSHYKKLINLYFLPSLSNWNNHLPSKTIVWMLFCLPLWLKPSPSLSYPYDRTPFFCSPFSLILIPPHPLDLQSPLRVEVWVSVLWCRFGGWWQISKGVWMSLTCK